MRWFSKIKVDPSSSGMLEKKSKLRNLFEKEKKFNNVNQLRAQIKKDLNIAKKTK